MQHGFVDRASHDAVADVASGTDGRAGRNGPARAAGTDAAGHGTGTGTGAASPPPAATPAPTVPTATRRRPRRRPRPSTRPSARPGTIPTPAPTVDPTRGRNPGANPGSRACPDPDPHRPERERRPQAHRECTVTKDAAGFFTRTSSASSYVAYVPASYDGTAPVALIVGAHGCGDNAMNFATWGVNPYDTRTTQNHIGISVGGADGHCWTASDDAKVLAAIDDISSCFWVHQKKVVIAGFSSGGELAYRVGLSHASRFAGILIEDSGLYAANSNPDALLANASWKINIAHRTHTSDPVFPLATVKADWVKTKAAGFPLVTKETPGRTTERAPTGPPG